MRGCDPPPLRMASAACCVAPLASAPRFLAMFIREARRRASSNLSVADGINWLGTTTITVSIMKLSQNHADSKQEDFPRCKQNHNKIASYLHLLLEFYIAHGTKAFLTRVIYLCARARVCGRVRTHARVVSALT